MLKTGIMSSIYNYIKPNIKYIGDNLIINDKKDDFGCLRCKQFNNDVTGDKIMNHNDIIYGAMLYTFDTETGETLKITGNHSIKNLFLNKLAYQEPVELGSDPLSPVKYNRKIFKNIVCQYNDDCYIVLSIINPLNSKPFIKNPSNQLCIYVCIASNNFSSITNIDYPLEPIGFIDSDNGINIISSCGHTLVYPLPHITILDNNNLLNFIYSEIKNAIYGITNLNSYILGSQTLETVSVLWSHVHTLLLDDIDDLSNNVTDTFHSYNEGGKFIKPLKRN